MVTAYIRVPMPPEKSWNLFAEFSKTWKVLENELGPGKCWKSQNLCVVIIKELA